MEGCTSCVRGGAESPCDGRWEGWGRGHHAAASASSWGSRRWDWPPRCNPPHRTCRRTWPRLPPALRKNTPKTHRACSETGRGAGRGGARRGGARLGGARLALDFGRGPAELRPAKLRDRLDLLADAAAPRLDPGSSGLHLRARARGQPRWQRAIWCGDCTRSWRSHGQHRAGLTTRGRLASGITTSSSACRGTPRVFTARAPSRCVRCHRHPRR